MGSRAFSLRIRQGRGKWSTACAVGIERLRADIALLMCLNMEYLRGRRELSLRKLWIETYATVGWAKKRRCRFFFVTNDRWRWFEKIYEVKRGKHEVMVEWKENRLIRRSSFLTLINWLLIRSVYWKFISDALIWFLFSWKMWNRILVINVRPSYPAVCYIY